MPDVAFADAPGFVFGWSGYSHAILYGQRVGRIDIGRRWDPPGHPDGTGVIIAFELGEVSAARALGVFAEEYFALAGGDRAERRRVSPIPEFLPTELLEPRERTGEIRDIQYGRDGFNLHATDPSSTPAIFRRGCIGRNSGSPVAASRRRIGL